MDKGYWVGFNMVRGIGAVWFQSLLDHFGDLSVAWQASVGDAPGTPPDASNFPPRNRIISGMTMAMVVGETSGVLITAQFAVDQGREVFAVPGTILAPQSKGTNKLIADGARPLLSVRDLLEALNLTRVVQQREVRKASPADDVESKLLNVLSHEPLHMDEICNQTRMPVERVSATLVMMESKSLVRQVGGNNYVAVREEQAIYKTESQG
jgi:DNA processing protein